MFLRIVASCSTLRVSKSTTHITRIALIIALLVSQVFNSIVLFKTSEYLAPTASVVVQLLLAVFAVSAVANCWGYHIQAPHSTASVALASLHLLCLRHNPDLSILSPRSHSVHRFARPTVHHHAPSCYPLAVATGQGLRLSTLHPSAIVRVSLSLSPYRLSCVIVSTKVVAPSGSLRPEL